MNRATISLVLGSLLFVSCTGSDNQGSSVLREFRDSGCKKERGLESASDTASITQALVSADYSTETMGLKCFAWESVAAGGLKIDLYNFEGPCGAEWTGEASLQDLGALALSLVNPDCLIASCGSCIYDWSFEVADFDTSQPLPVSVGIDTCPGEQEVERLEATLPVDTQQSGILCNYANHGALGWQAMSLGECGTLGMPCVSENNCPGADATTEPGCEGELTCTDNGDSTQRICAKACSAEADCGELGVWGCTEGLCRPKNGW